MVYRCVVWSSVGGGSRRVSLLSSLTCLPASLLSCHIILCVTVYMRYLGLLLRNMKLFLEMHRRLSNGYQGCQVNLMWADIRTRNRMTLAGKAELGLHIFRALTVHYLSIVPGCPMIRHAYGF
ncbi:hypothetical protein M426DRAFT_165824 [Hypoxylon sp. CI-4A]|nr:hypothetical protein M426DRAFT_165824 [Hypoxylon sp. CI-4A]